MLLNAAKCQGYSFDRFLSTPNPPAPPHPATQIRVKFHLPNRNQHVSTNGYDSGLAVINCAVPQGSAVRPLLFLLHSSDFNQAVKFCKAHHFADGIYFVCLLCLIK